jgi:hypothetical protein
VKTELEIALEAELARANAIIDSLTETISQYLSDGENQRRALQDRLNGLMEERVVLADRVSAAEAKYAQLQQDVENNSVFYQNILAQQEELANRLNESLKEPTFKKTTVGESLCRNGLYATSNKDKEMVEEKQQLNQTHQP